MQPLQPKQSRGPTMPTTFSIMHKILIMRSQGSRILGISMNVFIRALFKIAIVHEGREIRGEKFGNEKH